MLRYKNVTEHELQVVGIPGVGHVAAGAIVETVVPIENPNFQLVKEDSTPAPVAPVAPVAPTPAPETPANPEKQ